MSNISEDRNMGRIGIVLKEEYDPEKTYTKLNQVTYSGSSYTLKVAEATGILPTNTDYWICSAKRGDQGEKGDKGDVGPIGPKPVNGTDYNTNAEREEFKNAVVADSKADLEKYITEKETQLDNYTKNKKTNLDDYVTDTVKPTIDTYVTDTTKKGIDAYEKEKEKVLDTYTDTKKTEIDNYVTNTSKPALDQYEKDKEAELETAKNAAINEYDAHTEKLTNRIADLEEENSELAQQMPWNTTEIQESIYVADSARYSKNKLSLFGNMAQETREGYNLLDISNIQTQEKYGVTITNNGDGTLTFNGTSTNNFGINTEIEPKTLLAGNYTKSIPRDTNIKTGLTISLGTVSGGPIPKTTLQPSTGTATFELEEDSTYNQLRMYIGSGTIFNNYVLKWMIVKGTYTSETIPPFEQYGAMPSIEYPSMPVVTTGLQTVKKYSKNLCKRFINGSTYRYSAAFYLDCNLEKGKYYALSFTDLSVGNVYYRNENVTGANGEYSSYTITSTGKRQTWIFLCKENNKNMGGLYFKNRGYYFLKNNKQQEQPSNLVDVQLEEVTSLSDFASDYEQYKGEEITLDLENIELAKITNENGEILAQDRAVYRQVDGILKWQWEKNVYKDSITNLNSRVPLEITSYLADNLCGAVFNSSKKHKILGQVIAIMSDKLKAKLLGPTTDTTNTDSVRNAEGIALHSSNNNQICITLEKTRLESEDLEGVKNFINENNIIYYYPILEPIYLDCTEEQSAVLDKLYKLSLEKRTNNIFVESENGVTTELQLEYMQDNNLKKEQKNKALEDRITAIENLLSTTETSALLLDNMQNDLEKEVE